MRRISKLVLAAVFLVSSLCGARAYGQGGATGAIALAVLTVTLHDRRLAAQAPADRPQAIFDRAIVDFQNGRMGSIPAEVTH